MSIQVNVTHIVHHFSFGKKLSTKHQYELDRLVPAELQWGKGGHQVWEDRLADQGFLSPDSNVTHEHYMKVNTSQMHILYIVSYPKPYAGLYIRAGCIDNN